MTVDVGLAAALDVWMAGAEPGERSPYARLAVTDPAGAILTSHELTYRQAVELTGLIADTAPGSAGELASELGHFAGPSDSIVVSVTVDGPAAPATVGLSARAAEHLHELLEYGLAQRASARRLIERQSPVQAGQRIRVQASGAYGTVAYLTVTWPLDSAGQAILWCHVHLDAADSEYPTAFSLSALTPVC